MRNPLWRFSRARLMAILQDLAEALSSLYSSVPGSLDILSSKCVASSRSVIGLPADHALTASAQAPLDGGLARVSRLDEHLGVAPLNRRDLLFVSPICLPAFFLDPQRRHAHPTFLLALLSPLSLTPSRLIARERHRRFFSFSRSFLKTLSLSTCSLAAATAADQSTRSPQA